MIKLHDGVVECLHEALSKGPVVVLTAGIPEVWRIALRNHGLPVGNAVSEGIVVHGLVDGEHGLVMDEQGKETFAKSVKEKGYYVVAAGDSQIDTGMLRAADAAFIVSRDLATYETELIKRRSAKWSDAAAKKNIKNERLIILLATHPRVFQIPSGPARVAVNGPQLSSFKDLVHDATRPGYVKGRNANDLDWIRLANKWLEEFVVEQRKNAK